MVSFALRFVSSLPRGRNKAGCADIPGGQRFVEATHALRDRLDELQHRVRSLDPLERPLLKGRRRGVNAAGDGDAANPLDEPRIDRGGEIVGEALAGEERTRGASR